LPPDLNAAQMAKLVDAADSKSAASNGVLVRFQFWARKESMSNKGQLMLAFIICKQTSFLSNLISTQIFRMEKNFNRVNELKTLTC
jgi:hypothetical protein